MPTLTFQLHPHIEAFLESEITRLVVGGGNFEHSGQHPRDDYLNLLNIIIAWYYDDDDGDDDDDDDIDEKVQTLYLQ